MTSPCSSRLFAPHVAEEIWQSLVAKASDGVLTSLAHEPWPTFDPALIIEDTVEIGVQVNGKVREHRYACSQTQMRRSRAPRRRSTHVFKAISRERPSRNYISFADAS